ncbi:hypothetical protein ACT21L_002508 [Vibrio vulnificus]
MAKFLTALAFARHPRERGEPFKARGCFEWIKLTKSVRSAFAEEWIPACAGMTDIESGEISYRPHFCSLSS